MAETPSAVESAGPVPASELRTFLFADVRGYTRFTQERGDEAAARLVRKFAALTREGVEAHAGRLIELRGDEALAVFGSAREALRAAIELQERFQEASREDPSLPLPVGIGIDAGEAVRVEDGYRGDALNLAARLCNLAGPGEVLASEGVVYLGRRVQGIAYQERGRVPLKGFADPVPVIRVAAAPEASLEAMDGDSSSVEDLSLPIGGFLGALPSGVLVGRDEEWQRMMSTMETVMRGSGRLVLLSGEPGIGKTRLAQEVTLKARHWGFLVGTGRCYEPERSVPYYPFLEPLTTLYTSCPASVRAEVSLRWPFLLRLLPQELLPPALEPPAGVGEALQREDQQRLFRAVTGFLQAIAETAPVALLLDDLHWADDSSLLLLQHLARYTRGHRLLLVGTYRDVEVNRQHLLETALFELNREQLVEEVEVRRLDLEGTRALVSEVLGEKGDLGDLPELVFRRTEGNAFFIGEMLRALVERGDVYRKDGRWEQRQGAEMEVPKSIRSLIGQRLSRLDDRAQEILREASVLGQRFAFDDLLALGSLISRPGSGAPPAGDPSGPRQDGWTEDEIEAALEGGIAAGLIREGRDDMYAFNHALTQQTLYAELSTRRRKRLHLAAGKALEMLLTREHGKGRERRAGELAWHFLEGDDAQEALPYTLLAGDQAEEVFAHGEAEREYRTAVELAQELHDRAREVVALRKLAGVLAIVARYDQALEILERAAHLYQEAGDREGEACAVAQIGQIHYQRDTAKEGIARLRPLVEAYEAAIRRDGRATGSAYGLAALWAALARLYGDTEDHEEQVNAAERAIALARELRDRRDAENLLLGAEITLSAALLRMGRDEEAKEMLQELIPRAEAAHDLENLSRALGNAAVFYAEHGELGKYQRYRERALEIAERRGDLGQILLQSLQLSRNDFLTGDWQQARVHLERAEEIVSALGASRLSTWPLAARGWLSLREGNLEAAEASAQEAASLPTGGDVEWRRLIDRLLAEIDLLGGDAPAALAHLTPWMELPGSHRDSAFLRTLASVYLALGRAEEAYRLATEALDEVRNFIHQSESAETLVVQGMAAAAAGRLGQAEESLERALAVARSLSFRFGEARALEEQGRLRARAGRTEEARQALAEALALYQRLGAMLDAERASRAIDALPHQA